MTIEAFFLCYNESKMIEHTLNYHTRFCDKITVLDNQSTDNSVAIIREKFPHVIVEEFDTNGEYREDVLMKIRNNRWKDSEADYVIMADMDEFIVDDNLLDKLEAMKRQKVAVPNITGYNMFSEAFPDDYSRLITEQVTQKFRDRTFDKKIIFSPKWVKEMNFGVGSHICNPVYREGVAVQTNHSFTFNLFHFKFLSREYLYKRHRGYATRMSEMNRFLNYGHQYSLGDTHVDHAFDKIGQFLKHKQRSLTPAR